MTFSIKGESALLGDGRFDAAMSNEGSHRGCPSLQNGEVRKRRVYVFFCCDALSKFLLLKGCGERLKFSYPFRGGVRRFSYQGKTELLELVLDLVERLLTEVTILKHFLFGLHSKLTNSCDISIV